MTLFADNRRSLPDQLLSSEPVRLVTIAGIDKEAILEHRTTGVFIRTTKFLQRPGITMQRFIEWYWGENADFGLTVIRGGNSYSGTGALTQRPLLAGGSPVTFITSVEEPLQLRIRVDEHGLQESPAFRIDRYYLDLGIDPILMSAPSTNLLPPGGWFY